MIHVSPEPEPANFNILVRQPGRKFLRLCPRPSSRDFQTRRYWSSSLPDLVRAYHGICAYSSLPVQTQGSVDHFRPKSSYPMLAYEWSNYRLSLPRINNNKGESQNVLDPFAVIDGWFQLDLATLYVVPNPELAELPKKRVQQSIDILRLNDDIFVETRFNAYSEFLKGDQSIERLKHFYPFIASEVARQSR